MDRKFDCPPWGYSLKGAFFSGFNVIMNARVIERIDRIKNDRLHGAGWLSREAINTLNMAVSENQASTTDDFLHEIRIVATGLMEARPSMISIANYVNRFVSQIILISQKEKGLDSLKTLARGKGDELIKSSEETALKVAQYGCDLISNRDIVITCSYSSTVCRVFQLAKQKGMTFHVMAVDSWFKDRAYGEITAKQLREQRISVEILPDEFVSLRVSRADKALVGADSILADGSLINGIPTHALASVARAEGIPFYTVSETAKFDIQGYISKASEPETGFDKTPPDLITGIVTENGITEPGQVITQIEGMARLITGG